MGRERTVTSKAHGFGLIELLVTLSLVAILATVAVPSFQHLINETRVTSEANNFLDALYSARSYAVRNNSDVVLCPSSNSLDCSAQAPTFSTGWIIKTVQSAADEPPLRAWPKPNVSVTQSFANGVDSIYYHPNGLPYSESGAFAAGTVTFCAGKQGRDAILSANGRVRIDEATSCGS